LEQAGSARDVALSQADAELDRIAELLPGALSAGLSLSEIARITGVSRPTLYELQRRRGGARDVDLELLVALAAAGPQSPTELSKSVGVSAARLRNTVERLVEKGWLERLEGPGGVRLATTQAGEAALDGWDFGGRFEERTTKTLRLVLDALRFTPEERADVERKIARAEAEGTERLGFLEAIRMGTEAELARLRARSKDQ
jgi:DNA-binding MarR family transcriptional regulator